MTISIDLCNQISGKYFGLCMIENKSPMTHETLAGLADLVNARLHYVLSQQDQEGEMDPMEFREVAHPMVRGCVNEVAEFFGEDATVSMDLNLDFHGLRAMKYLYQADLKIVLGVMREEGWTDVVLTEGWMQRVMELMA